MKLLSPKSKQHQPFLQYKQLWSFSGMEEPKPKMKLLAVSSEHRHTAVSQEPFPKAMRAGKIKCKIKMNLQWPAIFLEQL